MRGQSRLTRSIILATFGHLAVQLAIFTTAAITVGMPAGWIAGFAPVSTGVHLVFGIFLVVMKDDFVTVRGDRRLEVINLANVLTMFRISSVPTILYLIFLSNSYPTLPWLIGVTASSFVTDLLDGQISRLRREVTRIGRYLDSSSDYTILTAMAIAFTYFGFVSDWFFWLLILRLGTQFMGMVGLFVYQGGTVEPRSSFLGKASVLAAMVVFALSLLKLVESITETARLVALVAEFIASAVIVVSIGDKVMLIYRDFRDAIRKKKLERESREPMMPS